MLWIGEVEDVKNIDDLNTSASVTGRPKLHFRNIDLQVASGLRKIPTGNFKNESPQLGLSMTS